MTGHLQTAEGNLVVPPKYPLTLTSIVVPVAIHVEAAQSANLPPVLEEVPHACKPGSPGRVAAKVN